MSKTSTEQGTEDDVQATPSAGALRQSVVGVLADAKEPMTIKAIERAVGTAHPADTRDLLEDAVDSLIQDELVSRATRDSRRLALTERGQRLASGLRALAAG